MTPATTYAAIVGHVVGQMRRRLKLSQGDLSGLIRLSQATWSRIECGTQAITLAQLHTAAGALGVRPHQILEYADKIVVRVRGRGVAILEIDEVRDANALLARDHVLIAPAALALLAAAA